MTEEDAIAHGLEGCREIPAKLRQRARADVSIPKFEPELYPHLYLSRGDSVGANLRFKSPDLAATTRFARRGPGGLRI